MIDAPAISPAIPEVSVALGPVAPSRRIESVDILRGIAILGIFLVNMLSYSGFRQPFEQMTLVDKSVNVLIKFLAQAKFYPLFSLLFGWGMAVQMERAAARGMPFVPFYLRRMISLLLIGLVHAILIWHGDILVTYALLGIPLLLFRKAPDRVILLAVIICMLVPVLISTPGPGGEFRTAYTEAAAPLREEMIAGKRLNVFSTGSYPEAVLQRSKQVRFSYAMSLYWATHVFGMMLVGLWVGRKGILQDIPRYRPALKKVMWGSLAVGIVLNIFWVWATVNPDLVSGDLHDLATRGVRTIGGPALTLFYLTAVVLIADRAAWNEQLSGLAAAGRMTLTNYLLQSVICTLIFYGYGLGAFGDMGPFLTLLLTLLIFRFQIAFSVWWLHRYRFGPAEWLWRSMSYGKLQPMQA